MAALAPERATDPRVRSIAARIAGVQRPEIAALRAWLGRQDHATVGHGGHASDHAQMPGMATPAQLATLGTVSGPAFDRMFLDLMTAHHRGALAMAQDVLTTGTDVTVSEFAQDVIATQTVEIDRMRLFRD